MGNTVIGKTNEFSNLNELNGISAKSVGIHRDKLYAGYVNKATEIGEELAEFSLGKKLSDGNQTYSELRALRNGETFARNGIYLHEYYFKILGGDGEIPENNLTLAIKEGWGSIDQFIAYFSSSALAVRGWAVLCWDTQVKKLKVYGCDAHDQGGVWGCLPIIVLDVYEHAYFIDFGADRKAYIDVFWKNMNWKIANDIYLGVYDS